MTRDTGYPIGSRVNVNGQPFVIVGFDAEGDLIVQRPKGQHAYIARLIRDGYDFMYGERRAKLVSESLGPWFDGLARKREQSLDSGMEGR